MWTRCRRRLTTIRRITRLLPLTLVGIGSTMAASAEDAGTPANFDRRDAYRYSFEHYRDHGGFGRPGEHPNDRGGRGYMSSGHGPGHR